MDHQRLNVNFYFGGTSLLIVVGVAMDTVNQIESQLIMRHYEGFTPRSGRIRGRRTGLDKGVGLASAHARAGGGLRILALSKSGFELTVQAIVALVE